MDNELTELQKQAKKILEDLRSSLEYKLPAGFTWEYALDSFKNDTNIIFLSVDKCDHFNTALVNLVWTNKGGGVNIDTNEVSDQVLLKLINNIEDIKMHLNNCITDYEE